MEGDSPRFGSQGLGEQFFVLFLLEQEHKDNKMHEEEDNMPVWQIGSVLADCSLKRQGDMNIFYVKTNTTKTKPKQTNNNKNKNLHKNQSNHY